MKNTKNQLAVKLPNTGGIIPTSHRLANLAKETKLFERATRKISAPMLLGALISSIALGENSCRAIALAIGMIGDVEVSRVAVWKFLKKKAIIPFIEAIIAFAVKKSVINNHQNPILEVTKKGREPIPGVNRILIGDATHLRLHGSLAEAFPGPKNRTDRKIAMLKFQLVIDLLTGRAIQCSLDPYKRSDAKAALDILPFIEKGDLLIRDLGFATMDSFLAIMEKGAYFISRLKIRVHVLDRDGKRINLLSRLRREAPRPGQSIRIPILMTETHQVKCELIAIRVPEEVANERRRKLVAKHKEQSWPAPSEEYKALQDWTLLVTNLPEEAASNQKIRELYLMRWRIELIFKACKSHTSLLKVARHKTNQYHAKALILTWILLMIMLADRGKLSMAKLREVLCPESHAVYYELDIHHQSLFKTLRKSILNLAFHLELSGCNMDPIEHSERTQYYDRIHNKTDLTKGRIGLSQVLESVMNPKKEGTLS